MTVVAKEVKSVIDDAHLDAFLANCECRHESRNMVLIKVIEEFEIFNDEDFMLISKLELLQNLNFIYETDLSRRWS